MQTSERKYAQPSVRPMCFQGSNWRSRCCFDFEARARWLLAVCAKGCAPAARGRVLASALAFCITSRLARHHATAQLSDVRSANLPGGRKAVRSCSYRPPFSDLEENPQPHANEACGRHILQILGIDVLRKQTTSQNTYGRDRDQCQRCRHKNA